MIEKSITPSALKRLKKIHRLSKKYNFKVKYPHNKRLLSLIKEHAEEIEDLMKRNDPHAFVETGDLLVLCFEVLIENGIDIDKTMLKCYKRYENKLNSLIKNMGRIGDKSGFKKYC